MERSLASPAALQRVGVGMIAGALLLLLLALALLPEIAVLLVIGIGMAVYVYEQREQMMPGLALGIASAGVVLALYRELAPVGATVPRSVLLAVAIGVALVLGSLVVERFTASITDDPD